MARDRPYRTELEIAVFGMWLFLNNNDRPALLVRAILLTILVKKKLLNKGCSYLVKCLMTEFTFSVVLEKPLHGNYFKIKKNSVNLWTGN